MHKSLHNAFEVINSYSPNNISLRLWSKGDKLESAISDSSLQDELSQSFIHFTDEMSLLNEEIDKALNWKDKFKK